MDMTLLKSILSVGLLIAYGKCVALNTGSAVGLKEVWTPGCVPSPLPVNPVGPTSSVVASGTFTAGGFSVRVTGWRVRCSDSDHQVLFTFVPLTGQVYPGSLRVTLIQRGFQYTANIATSGPLLVPETSRIFGADGVAGAPEFDDDLGFEVVFADVIMGTISRILMGAAPVGPGQSVGLRGALSGSWYDPSRSGHGLMLEFGRVGPRKVAFVTWYVQIQGQQAWIVGNKDYLTGDVSLELDLYRTQGGGFPGSGVSAGTLVPWGSGTLRFPGCSELVFSYQSMTEGSGQLNMSRGLEGGIDGLACQNVE